METPQQRKVREALNRPAPADHSADADKEPEGDTSLQEQALEHTDPDYVPKTLTPYEWEQWYAEHGVPESHRHPAKPEPEPETEPTSSSSSSSLWLRVLQFFRR